MRKFLSLILAFFFIAFNAAPAFAVYNPESLPNNRFGIHIADTGDLEDAASLVNSNGGDWGYVTFVITKTERDTWRWQKVFDRMRELHLIPVVRIATRAQGVNWEKPSQDETPGWVSFLNSLNWVIKNRYVVIGNEPNHAEEWGADVNPEEYAMYLKSFSQKLKESNPDFFILPAGFDASAPTSRKSISEDLYLTRMILKDPEVFNFVDGWASHSYPNPNFSASEWASGKGSVRTWQWELNFLKALGVKKDLPVFITETGWTHKDSISGIGTKFENAYKNAWNDKKIIAVTPFILGYNEPPFDIFSWKGKDGKFYDFYYQIQNLPKTKGDPLQDTKGEILALFLPPIHSLGSKISAVALVKNTGQSIWATEDTALISSYNRDIKISEVNFSDIEPGKIGLIRFDVLPPQEAGNYVGSVTLERNGTSFGNSYYFQIIAITPLDVKLQAIFDTILGYFKGR